MANDAIVHGAKEIIYWGTNSIDEPRFRKSLYALTSELVAIRPFLNGQRIEGVEARLIHDLFDPLGNGVRSMRFRNHNDFLLVSVNEENHHRLGGDFYGLAVINHRKLILCSLLRTPRIGFKIGDKLGAWLAPPARLQSVVP